MTIYTIQTRMPEKHAAKYGSSGLPWTTLNAQTPGMQNILDGMPVFNSRAEAEKAIRLLRTFGSDWNDADYRVVVRGPGRLRRDVPNPGASRDARRTTKAKALGALERAWIQHHRGGSLYARHAGSRVHDAMQAAMEAGATRAEIDRIMDRAAARTSNQRELRYRKQLAARRDPLRRKRGENANYGTAPGSLASPKTYAWDLFYPDGRHGPSFFEKKQALEWKVNHPGSKLRRRIFAEDTHKHKRDPLYSQSAKVRVEIGPTGATIWHLPKGRMFLYWNGPGSRLKLGHENWTNPGQHLILIDHPSANKPYKTRAAAQAAVKRFLES